MNVLLVADVSFDPSCGGAPRMLYEYASRLRNLGYNVHILTRTTEKETLDEEIVNGVIIHRYKMDRSSPIKFLISSCKNSFLCFNKIKERFNVINFHQPISAMGVLLHPRSWWCRKIYTFFSPAPMEYKTRILEKVPLLTFSLNYTFLKLAERICLTVCGKIIVLSEHSKNQLIYLHKTRASKISIVPGGVDINKFAPPKDKMGIRDILKLPEDKFILLTIRNLVPRMGIDNLIRAMAMLTKQNKDVLLIIGGEGPLENKLKGLTVTLHLEPYVKFVGFIDEAHLPLYYQAADLFVLPTKYLEAFGLVTLESLSSGTPVLGTPVGGTKEILGKLDKNLLFRGTDARSISEKILEFYASKERFVKSGEDYRRFIVKNYSWEKIIVDLERELLLCEDKDNV